MLPIFVAGCYSASLLTTPEPTPVGKLRATAALAIQPAPPGTDWSNSNAVVPLVEGSVRMGVHDGIDVGVKAGPLYAELNAMLRLAQGERWILSAMPGIGAAWLWERPGEGLGHAGAWHALGTVNTSTRISSLRLPLLLGGRGLRDRVGFVFGPTAHVGYRDCRSITKFDPDVSERAPITTCLAADKGAFVGIGGHVGLQLSIGTFVKLMPELSILGLPIAPRAREVYIDERREKFSRHDVIVHFAFGVQLGRFVRNPRTSWLDDV